MKAIAATLAIALTATLALPADAMSRSAGPNNPFGFDRSPDAPIFQVRRPLSREERFDRAFPNSGLSRAAKIALVISDESADTSTERRLPQVNEFSHNPSLGEVFGFGSRRRQPARQQLSRQVQATQATNGNYVFLGRR